MASNTVQYEALLSARSEIEASAAQIKNVATTMGDEIEQAMGAGGATALNGAAGLALKRAWEDFSNYSFPDIEDKLKYIFDTELPTWYTEFKRAEEEIESSTGTLNE